MMCIGNISRGRLFPAITLSGVQRQLAVSLIASFSLLITGTSIGWPAPTLKKLREPDSPIRLTPYEEAWVVSAPYITTFLSPLLSGFLMNRLGRKRLTLILALLPVLSWVLIYFSRSGSMLIVARVLMGFWYGGSETVVPIYTAEIAEAKVRGRSGSFSAVSLSVGYIFVYVLGPYISMPAMAVMTGILPVVFITLFLLCPESPYFYVMRGRQSAAAEALAWLRGETRRENIEKELKIIQTSIEREAKSNEGYSRQMLKLVTEPANRKAFIIVQVLLFLLRSSGVSALSAYSTVILPHQLGPLTADHGTLMMGIAMLVATLICTVLVDKVGRKPLLYISCFGIFITMIPMSIYYYLDRETTADVSAFTWVPFAVILSNAAAISIGINPITSIFRGEMFPSNLKGQSSALSVMNASAATIISVTVFTIVSEHVGLYANFIIFSSLGVVGVGFTYFYVIETKGKSLQMIQAELRGDVLDKTAIEQDVRDSEKMIKPKGEGIL